MSQPTRTPNKPRAGYTVGRSAFAKISAVEGIELTPNMDADFREFERRKLSPDDRRNAIKAKYGTVR
jgi:hypothetical protein